MRQMHRWAGASGLVLALTAPGAQAGYSVAGIARVSESVAPYAGPCPGSQRPRVSDHSLSVDPRDPRHVVAAWMQDRPGRNSGGAPSLAAAVSRDGGRTWRARSLAGLSRCDGGDGRFVSVNEAQVEVGREGTVYLTHHPQETKSASRGKVAVVRSDDGGETFGPQHVLGPEDTIADQAFIASDPRDPQHVYANWHDLDPDATGTFPFDSSLQLAESLDAGRTWSEPRLIRRTMPSRYGVASHLVAQPDGGLVLVYAELTAAVLLGPPLPGAEDATVFSVRSDDGGRTWSEPVTVAKLRVPAVRDPDTGDAVNLFSNETVAQARDGTIHVAWRDIGSDSEGRVVTTRSTDGGRSWDPSVTVAAPGAQTFLPEVATRPDGTVGISWLDFRNDRGGDGELTTDAWLATSADAGLTWEELHVLGPFDTRPTYAGDESLIGDTGGLDGSERGFVASFAVGPPLARSGDTELLAARVEPAPVRLARLRVAVVRRRAAAFFTLPAPARVRIALRRSGRTVRSRSIAAVTGPNRVPLGRPLRAGRYSAVARTSGSPPVRARFRVRD